jgi:CheY-like chemotaxis protein
MGENQCHEYPVNTASNASEPPQEPLRPDEDQTVLIADADEENASHVERQLRRAGVKNPIVVFKNGDDLHAFLADAAQTKTPAPCVLFLDPRMPGANGYDPVRWVKRETCFSSMRVIIFSSPDAGDETEIAAELGVTVFIKKHPDLTSLATIVEHLCDAQPEETPAPSLPIGEIKLA